MDLLVQKGLFVSQRWLKCLFYTIMFKKHFTTVQKLVLSWKYHFRWQLGRYILPFCAIRMDLLVQKGYFGSEKGSKVRIFYNNVYKRPYNGIKAGFIGKVSYQPGIWGLYCDILPNTFFVGVTSPLPFLDQ